MRLALLTLTVLWLALAPSSVGRAEDESKGDPLAAAREAALPSDLPELLDVALRKNPDIALAEAQLRAARAQLNQRRLEVARTVAQLHVERQRLRKHEEELRDRLVSVRTMHERSMASREDVREAVLAYAEVGAQLAQTQAELRYVLGLGGTSAAGPALDSFADAPRPEPRARPEHRSFDVEQLQKTIDVIHWDSETLTAVLEYVREAAGLELPFLIDPSLDYTTWRISLDLGGPVTLENALLAVTEYLDGKLCFVFRPYGVLATHPRRAEDLNAPTIPADLPLRGDR